MDNFRDSYFNVDWDLTTKRLKGTYWGKQYDTGRGFAVTVINGGQVVAPTTEVLRLKWEKPDNTTGYVNATIVNGKFIVENIDQMFTVHGSVRADFELSVGGKFVASITFYVNVEKAVAVDAVASSSEFTALQTAITTVDGLDAEMADMTLELSKTVKKVNGVSPNLSGNVTIEVPQIDDTNLLRGIVSVTEPPNPTAGLLWIKPILPPIPVTDYYFRFDASVLNLANNAQVSEWTDLSPNGNNLVPVSTKPTYLSSGFNGRPTVAFNNSPMGKTSFVLDRVDKYTIFVVHKFDTIASMIGFSIGEPSTDPAIARRVATVLSGSGKTLATAINNQVVYAKVPVDTNPFLYTSWYDNANMVGYKNGSQVATNPFAYTINTHNSLRIGGDLNPTSPTHMQGKISEIVYFSRALSAGEIASVNSYLMDKWGL